MLRSFWKTQLLRTMSVISMPEAFEKQTSFTPSILASRTFSIEKKPPSAAVCRDHPKSAEMFAYYLHIEGVLPEIGYCTRLPASAVQYGQKLLQLGNKYQDREARRIAEHLVYHFKDHGFVIDSGDADEIFGNNFIKAGDTQICLFSEFFYQEFNAFKNLMDFVGLNLKIVGNPRNADAFDIREIKG
jgi:hypothetical protein